MEAHNKAGHKSPTGLAFDIVSILRNQTSGIPTVVGWDFALNFAKKFFELAKKRGINLAKPCVVYHWTPKKNTNLIIDGNLKVPDGRKILHQTDQGYFGRGVYTAPDPIYGQRYGRGARETILCLAIPGKKYTATYADSFGKPLRHGFDMHISRCGKEWVFFDSDQLLPIFVIEPQKIKLTKKVIGELLSRISKAYFAFGGIDLQ